MRWPEKTPSREGDHRSRRKFLWFPLCLKGEWRWLERAEVIQVYRKTHPIFFSHGYSPGQLVLAWCDESWKPQEKSEAQVWIDRKMEQLDRELKQANDDIDRNFRRWTNQ